MTAYEEYGGGMTPDYESPILLEKVTRLIEALGERYDDDPRVAFLDVGILGHWGEWHTYPHDELFASASVQLEVMNVFQEAFKNKKMMLRYPTLRSARLPFGYRDDCFLTDTDGPEDWYFFSRFRTAKAGDIWKTQPIGGEFCGGGAGAIEGTTEQPQECLRLIREGHFSHLGPAGGSMERQSEEHQETVDEMLRTMGYRFVIREAEIPKNAVSGEQGEVKIELENTGSAPFYYNWPLEWVWLDGREEILVAGSEIDITQWLPGKHEVTIPITAPASDEANSFKLALRIPDPGDAGPPVRFANEGEEINGGFVLGSVSVSPAVGCSNWKELK